MLGSAFAFEGFAGEVIEGEGEQSEHDVADPVVVERVVFGKTPELPVAAVLLGVVFDAANYNTDETNQTACRDQS